MSRNGHSTESNVLLGAAVALFASAGLALTWGDVIDSVWQSILVPIRGFPENTLPWWNPVNGFPVRTCILCTIIYSLGTIMVYDGLSRSDLTRFPTHRTRILVGLSFAIKIGSIPFLAGTLTELRSILHSLHNSGDASPLFEAAADFPAPILFGWIGFGAIFLGQLAQFPALLPSRERLLILKRPKWLRWMALLAIFSIASFAILLCWSLHRVIETQVSVRDSGVLAVRDWDPTVLGRATLSFSNLGLVALGAFAIHLLCASAFLVGYFRCYREATHARIFVSYRRTDSGPTVSRVFDRLVERFGKGAVFKDTESIPVGMPFREYIGSVIADCPIVLVFIGPNWLSPDTHQQPRLFNEDDYVRMEIEEALSSNSRIIPVLARGASMPSSHDLPPSISPVSGLNGVPVREDPDFEDDIEHLCSALENDVLSSKEEA